MITIHHLGVSQSDRIVWLMEELHLPYRLKWHKRTESGLAPNEYLALHPAATAPVIEDEGTALTESAVIAEYICHRYAGGKLTVRPEQSNYAEYLYFSIGCTSITIFSACSSRKAHWERGSRVAAPNGYGV